MIACKHQTAMLSASCCNEASNSPTANGYYMSWRQKHRPPLPQNAAAQLIHVTIKNSAATPAHGLP